MPSGFFKLIFISIIFHLIFFIFFYRATKNYSVKKFDSSKITYVKLTKGFTGEDDGNYAKKTKELPKTTIREKKKASPIEGKKKSPTPKKENIFKKEKVEPKKTEPKIEAKKEIVKEQPPKKVEPKKEVPKEKPKPKPKPPKKSPPKKAEKTKEELLMEKALAELNQEVTKREEGGVIIEQAQIDDADGGLTPFGSDDEMTNKRLANYINQIISLIEKEWILIAHENKNAKAKLKVDINNDGSINNISITEPSSDIAYNLSAKRAIERAAPFPLPDEEHLSLVLNEGFLIEFKPQSVVGQ
jgi:TonB family protein